MRKVFKAFQSFFESPEDIQKANLEAFLSTFPGAYCGFMGDGTILYGEEFLEVFDLKSIHTPNDIIVKTEETYHTGLREKFVAFLKDNQEFELDVRTYFSGKSIKLTGKIGRDSENKQEIHVLWAEPLHEISYAEKRTSEEEALRNKIYQSALDNVPLPLWIRSEEQTLIWCNKAYSDLMEDERQKLLKSGEVLSYKDRTSDGQRAGTIDSLASHLSTQQDRIDVEAYVVSQGQRKAYNLTEQYLDPIEDKTYGMGYALDVSSEESVRQDYQAYIKVYLTLLELLQTAIAIFTKDQRLEFYNTTFAALWGLEERWLNTQPTLSEILEKLRENRRLPEQVDFKKYKQGWLDMFKNLLKPHDDMLYLPTGATLRMLAVPRVSGGLLMTFEDVSSRLALESSYNTLVAVQKETLDNLEEAVCVYGEDGRLKLWNPAFMSLWHFSPEVLDKNPHISEIMDQFKAVFPDKTWPEIKETMVSIGLDRETNKGELHLKDNRQINYITAPLPDGGVMVTFTDFTDAAQVEKALRDRNAALETAERLKMDFLANVSYQLRTPLSTVMGFSEILEKEYFGPLNDRQHEYTSGIHEASERLLGLINDILDLSTIEAGYLRLNKTQVTLKPVLDSIADLVEEWAKKDNVKVEIECPKNLPSIYVDERRLKQVLINLIRNAIAFTQDKGTVLIKAKRQGEDVLITVSDTGEGIAREDQDRIFEPFEKAQDNSGPNARGGAGLGLALVKNIVKLNNGTISLSSEVNKGTDITIAFPYKQTQKNAA